MEVMALAPPNMDFNFHSAFSSPCSSTPSSPKHFHDYEFYFNTPTLTMEKPGEPKSFDFSDQLGRDCLTIGELFDGCIIQSLKPQSQLVS
uniref:Uncharacterized protein n=1 Tax=Nelumbo nucifera TaxID=4432 RepID=A0A822Y9K3_NELNU|nr:TPA_asm: hypothetical protein HUJ06_029163 [Nelumbo nucifera]